MCRLSMPPRQVGWRSVSCSELTNTLPATNNRGGGQRPRPVEETDTKMRKALHTYGRALAAQHGKEWDPALVTGDVFPGDRTRTWATLEEQRPSFEALTHRLRETFGIDPDRQLITTLRHEARVEAGLVPLAESVVGRNTAVPVLRSVEPRSRILDTELIAIYW